MSKIVDLSDYNYDIKSNPDAVLHGALEEGLSDVIIIGWDKDGNRFYSSSLCDGFQALWLLELTKKKLLEVGDAEPILSPAGMP